MADAEPRRSRSSKRAAKKTGNRSKSRGKWTKAKNGWHHKKGGGKKRTLSTIPEERSHELEEYNSPSSSSTSSSSSSSSRSPKKTSRSRSGSGSTSSQEAVEKRSRTRSELIAKGEGCGRPVSDGEIGLMETRGSGSYLPSEGCPPDLDVAASGPLVAKFLKERGFSIGSHIRDGGYSSVFAATFTSSKGKTLDMAVKVLDLENLSLYHSNYVEYRLQTELDFMKSADHPNIVMTYRVFEPAVLMYEKRVYMFMERMDFDLAVFIHDRQTPLDEAEAKNYMRQVFLGMEYMHNLKLAHLDIKLDNILIRGPVAKMSDFGHIKQVYEIAPGQFMTSQENGGTRGYIAPEREMAHVDHHPMKCDIWSLGVTVYKCLTRRYPYAYKDRQQRINAERTSRPLYSSNDDHLSAEVRHLIDILLVYDPNQRLNITEYLSHPWFELE